MVCLLIWNTHLIRRIKSIEKNKTHPAHEYTVLDIEQHMSNKHIGNQFHEKNDGAPLLIVFPEYDNGDDDDKNTCCIK